MNGEFHTSKGFRRCRAITLKEKQCTRKAHGGVGCVNVCRHHYRRTTKELHVLRYVAIPGLDAQT
jgi:hypothetical protein